MKRKIQAYLLIALMATFGVLADQARAFEQYSINRNATNCRACHGNFRASPYISLSDGQSWGNDLHDVHRTDMLSNDCNVCHAGPKFPVLLNSSNGGTGLAAISCMGCHGRAEDKDAGGYGAGLRQHHTAAGVIVCMDCHLDAYLPYYTPVKENVLPPYYANPGTNHPNMPTDPCNLDGNEDFAGSPAGLDNDGDRLYDALDPDCPSLVPDIVLTDSTAPADDYRVAFGMVTTGSFAEQTVTVANAGTADLVLGSVASADPLAAPFGLSPGGDDCSGAILAPAASCTITLRFTPTSASAASDTFEIPTNDPDENPVTISLDGTGISVMVPDIMVTDMVAPADDLLVPFGIVRIGRTAEQMLTLTNAGTADLVLGNLGLADPLATPFSIAPGSDACSGATLAPAANCSVMLRFAPTVTTVSSDSFDIPSNDPDENPVTLSLSGTGIANSPPSVPVLIGPANGDMVVDSPVIFEWDRSTDPDGDALTYDLFICTDSSFATCDPVNATPIVAAIEQEDVARATTGFAMVCIGFLLAGSLGRRQKRARLLALAILVGIALAACGGGGGGGGLPAPHGEISFSATGLQSGNTYYWKVVASDGLDATDSATGNFTTP